jgi:hypothetical protein
VINYKYNKNKIMNKSLLLVSLISYLTKSAAKNIFEEEEEVVV